MIGPWKSLVRYWITASSTCESITLLELWATPEWVIPNSKLEVVHFSWVDYSWCNSRWEKCVTGLPIMWITTGVSERFEKLQKSTAIGRKYTTFNAQGPVTHGPWGQNETFNVKLVHPMVEASFIELWKQWFKNIHRKVSSDFWHLFDRWTCDC